MYPSLSFPYILTSCPHLSPFPLFFSLHSFFKVPHVFLDFEILHLSTKDYYQAFFWVLIDLIVELLGLIIKPFDNQTES
jgi:hypothetical protein